MAFRYRPFRRVSNGLPALFSGVRCQECGRSNKVFGSSLSPLCAPEKVSAGGGGAWRSLFFSRFSTAAEISKEVSHEVDLFSFMRSAFDHAEGPSHCWLNRSKESQEVRKKDGPVLLLAEAFLEDNRGSQVDRSSMIEKVKLLQQRYPWLHVYGLQSSSSVGSAADLNRLMHVIMEKYISFPILLCSKTFPEIAGGACCFLFKDTRDRPLYHDKDVDLRNLHEALKDLEKQFDKKASDADKLKSTWAKQPEGSNEPFICSSLQNMLLYNPACISVDEDGDRLFLSDSNHHRVIVFDSSGNILAVALRMETLRQQN
uniref:NHL repeat-containing protein 2 n=1 Tax=Opuntia streptacantha TaxID=393608 RepID=A0A7C9FNA9_OPUST